MQKTTQRQFLFLSVYAGGIVHIALLNLPMQGLPFGPTQLYYYRNARMALHGYSPCVSTILNTRLD